MTFSYQWERCNSLEKECINLPGATKDVYVPDVTDVDNLLRITVEAHNSGGSLATTSNATVVKSLQPVFVTRAGIDGIPSQGETLEADLGGLKGSPEIELTYQWNRCDEVCSPIPGASSGSYVLTGGDTATRITVSVEAENIYGSASSESVATEPVLPSETGGAPKLGDRPLLGGLHRLGGTMASTRGLWLGAASISTSMQWQRCDTAMESCETISGATDEAYEPTSEDLEMRLRSRVVAENGTGTATAYSLPSPEILPEVNTVFILENGTALPDVVEGIEASAAPWLTFAYEAENSGGYAGASTDPGEIVADLTEIFGKEAADQLSVTSFVLRGSVAAKDLGTLATLIAEREEVLSLRLPAPEAAKKLSEESNTFADDVITDARLEAGGPSDGFEPPGPLDVLPGFDRAIFTEFSWHSTPEETETEMTELGSDLAFEFDIKQINEENINPSFHVPIIGETVQGACLSFQSDDFWINDRDSYLFVTTIPPEAGAYWDTTLLDSCNEKDLTFGLYHPEELGPGEPYFMHIYFHGDGAAGDWEESQFTWSTQILGRHCDFDPNCVNLPLVDIDALISPVIAKEDEFDFYLGSMYHHGPAVFPGCYEFRNPLYEGNPELAGVYPCVYTS